MRILKLLVLMCMWLGLVQGAHAEDTRQCDSCRIRVDRLDDPLKLSGTWLFTRDDAPSNKDVGIDTTGWKIIKAPGPWKPAYKDGKVFPVGWYRGNLEFAPSLVGQEVVLLVNAYASRMAVYVDGQEVFHRPNNVNVDRYYSTQAVPVRFKITRPNQVLTIRIATPLMVGVYQLPFELRHYDPNDKALVMYQFLGGEARMIVGYAVALFGVFFLLIYLKTRYGLYLQAALTSLIILPFNVAPNDIMFAFFEPETLLYIHYVGIIALFPAFLFAQYFHKPMPRMNWLFGTVMIGSGLTIGSMVFWPNLALYQPVRSVLLVTTLFSAAMSLYSFVRGAMAKLPGSIILSIGMSGFLVAGINDVLLALGVIDSLAFIFAGVSLFIGTMLYVAASLFADTFLQNKALVKDLEVVNNSLEAIVEERTNQLRQKTQDIVVMLQNMPQGVLTIVADGTVHPEYSAYLETILESKRIAGRTVNEVLLSDTSLGADALDAAQVAVGACVGADLMNFEFNSHLLPQEFDKTLSNGTVKSLQLSWSPICDAHDTIDKLMVCVRDVTELKQLAAEAEDRRRELEMIGQILGLSQEKFHEFAEGTARFLDENRKLIEGASLPQAALINVLFRNMHTIKGNARTYGLLHMTDLVHSAEQAYSLLRDNAASTWDRASLLAQLEQVGDLLKEHVRVNDVVLGRKGPGRRGSVERFLLIEKAQISHAVRMIKTVDVRDLAAMQSALRDVATTLSLAGTDRLETFLSGTLASLPSLARELGKEPPRVLVNDADIRLRTEVAGVLRNVFTHLLRNSVDHGLESAAERVAAGKSAAGTIRLGAAITDAGVELTLSDDGRGLAIAKIRQRALDRGLLNAASSASDTDIANLIFAAGFSTAEKLTEVSGRGVGMDAVKGFLSGEGGSIEIRFLDAQAQGEYRPFELVISLPAKYAVSASAGGDLKDLPDFQPTGAAPIAGGH